MRVCVCCVISFSFVAYLPLVLLLVHVLFLRIYHVQLRSIVATGDKETNEINSPISLLLCPTWSPIIRLISPNGMPGLSLIRRLRDSLANTKYPQGARADDPRRLFFYENK